MLCENGVRYMAVDVFCVEEETVKVENAGSYGREAGLVSRRQKIKLEQCLTRSWVVSEPFRLECSDAT